jgi:glycosyltransferase involved in cell wall biosynthesis
VLLVDATTAEHTRGIRTVTLGVLGSLRNEDASATGIVVAAGPHVSALANLPTHNVPLARSRPGRLLYQRLLLPFDARRLGKRGNLVDRILLMDAYAPLVGLSSDVQYAALVHDTLPLSHPQYWPLSKRLVKREAFRSLRRRRAIMFTSTEYNAREIRRLVGTDAQVVRFGCGQLTDAEANASLHQPLPERKPYLLYVGAIEPRKGVLELLEIFERVRDVRSDLRLVIAGGGRGAYAREFANRVAAHHGADVEIVRDPGRHEAVDLLSHAAALVLPARAEGFGLPIIEAMALGTPVVATALPAIRSWADTAIGYAPRERPRNWVEPILHAVEASVDERRRAQQFVRDYRWRVCADALTGFWGERKQR